MNLRTHIIDSTNEGLGVFVEVRGKDKVSNLQVEVVAGVNIQILWFKIAMCKTLFLNGLKTVHKLLQVIACNRLRQATCLGEHDKEVGLICRKDEIGVHVSPEFDHAGIEALDYVRMVHDIENLLLVLCFVDLGLLLFVELYEHFNLLKLLHLDIRRRHIIHEWIFVLFIGLMLLL